MEMEFEREPIFMINDLETLKVFTDPLRIQILELLEPEPQTVKFVADALGLSSSRLYYHFNLLESTGLIAVAFTRTVNNIIEKYYWVKAEEIEINKEIMNYSSEMGPEDISRLVSATLDATRDDFVRSLQARRFNLNHGAKPNPKKVVSFRVKKRISDEAFEAYQEKMKELIEEFQDLPELEPSDPDANVYTVAYFLYPSYYYEQKDENEDGKQNG
jgi:DNA-binding transcriptional ArsR family regulator